MLNFWKKGNRAKHPKVDSPSIGFHKMEKHIIQHMQKDEKKSYTTLELRARLPYSLESIQRACDTLSRKNRISHERQIEYVAPQDIQYRLVA